MAAPVKLNITEIEKKIVFQREKCRSLEKFETVKEIKYTDFFKQYLFPNIPCIFTPNVTKHWKSRQDWVLEDKTPNFSLLRSKFGEAIVPVANCGQEQFSSHPKKDMLLSEYLDYWENYRSEGYPGNQPCLYLKDWHFTKAYPDYEAYITPVYFQSDWLNEFWDTLPLDDYRFVYMGPKGTWTPFHADVYRSFSWSANICGKKKWIFYPPGCEEMLKDNLGNLVYDVMSPDLDDQKKFPNAHKVKGQMLEIIQGEGQIIFVPSGWHHQVYNLEDTISINHNWLNGCNIDICWKHLQDGLQDVKMEIGHCQDMDGWNAQCQLILKACAGIDYSQFIKMLLVIAENRIKRLKEIREISHTAAALQTDNIEVHNDGQIKDSACKQTSNVEIHNEGQIIDSVFKQTSNLEIHNEGQIIDNAFKQTSNVEVNNEGRIIDNAFKTCCNIGTDFSLTEMYRALTESVDSDEGKGASRIEHCEQNCDIYADKTNNSRNIPENIESDMNKCGTSENDHQRKGTCEICEHNQTKMTVSENGGNGKCEHFVNCVDSSEWCESDYLLFDLYRIRQVLQNILSDDDYRKLQLECSDSAEYILNEIKLYLS